jgi:ElaB/YqjD/DUF883 family membrane-anchored ribosome-binding protein
MAEHRNPNKHIRKQTVADKNELIARMQGQIDEWKCEMKSLEEKAESASEDVKANCCAAVDELRCKCEEGEAKLEEWKAKAEDAWAEIQADAEQTFDRFKASIADSIDRVKSYFA